MMYCVLPCVLVRRCERSAAAWARCCRKCLRYGSYNNHNLKKSSIIIYEMNAYSMMLVIVANTGIFVNGICIHGL